MSVLVRSSKPAAIIDADVPDIDVTFVGDPDRFTPSGVKGVGEVGLIGVAPAIANAIHHAAGRRIRHLPIHLEELLQVPGRSSEGT